MLLDLIYRERRQWWEWQGGDMGRRPKKALFPKEIYKRLFAPCLHCSYAQRKIACTQKIYIHVRLWTDYSNPCNSTCISMFSDMVWELLFGSVRDKQPNFIKIYLHAFLVISQVKCCVSNPKICLLTCLSRISIKLKDRSALHLFKHSIYKTEREVTKKSRLQSKT